MADEDEKYTWMDIGTSGAWRIGYSVSEFLIFEGAGSSRQFGLYLYNYLCKEAIKWPFTKKVLDNFQFCDIVRI